MTQLYSKTWRGANCSICPKSDAHVYLLAGDLFQLVTGCGVDFAMPPQAVRMLNDPNAREASGFIPGSRARTPGAS